MRYDMDETYLKHIGIAFIMKKNKFKKDEKTINYYEIMDCSCGFLQKFNAIGLSFVSLSKKLGETFPFKPSSKSNVFAFGFINFNDLILANDNTLDIQEFISKYKQRIGQYYLYDASLNRYNLINDEGLIQQIKNFKKNKNEFDENDLNKNSNISQMYYEIKKTIISQDRQIMQILTTLFKNQKVVNGNFDIDLVSKLKENLLIYGSTGTGKTEILKRIAKIYNVPIVIEDATSFTEAGYVGRDINDMLNDMYLAANKNIELAQKGILVIDEFDKLAEKKSAQYNHISKEGVQRSLLKLLDGTEYYFNGITFNTSKLSIIALGAFTGISENDNYTNISMTDFVNYGIMRELMGRFSKLVAMNSLNKSDIKKILIESNFSPLNTYTQLFKSMNINFTYEDEFIDYISEKAYALNSGARSLKTIFDNIISDAMFKIFTGNYSSIHLIRPIHEEKPYILQRKKVNK